MTHAALVQRLLRSRVDREPMALPAALGGGFGADEAYRLQDAHAQAVLAHFGGSVIGTKLGGDPQALRELGLPAPLHGPIFSAFAFHSPVSLRRDDFFLCAVEAEIALCIGEDIGGTPQVPDLQHLRRAVDAVLPSLEIADSRFIDPLRAPPAAALADLCFAGAWVRGAEAHGWRDVDLDALPVTLYSNGTEVRRGSAARVPGGPLRMLGLLVAELGRSGRKLLAGQVVSTGSCIQPYLARAGETLFADFGPLGEVALSFN